MSDRVGAEGRQPRELSKRQLRAVDFLARGFADDDVGLMLKLQPDLVRYWRRHDLLFRTTVWARKADLEESVGHNVSDIALATFRLRPGGTSNTDTSDSSRSQRSERDRD